MAGDAKNTEIHLTEENRASIEIFRTLGDKATMEKPTSGRTFSRLDIAIKCAETLYEANSRRSHFCLVQVGHEIWVKQFRPWADRHQSLLWSTTGARARQKWLNKKLGVNGLLMPGNNRRLKGVA